jgi:hypothetical protein
MEPRMVWTQPRDAPLAGPDLCGPTVRPVDLTAASLVAPMSKSSPATPPWSYTPASCRPSATSQAPATPPNRTECGQN